MVSEEDRDEVTGRPVEAVQDVGALVAGWVRRTWAQRCRADWPIAWYAPFLTAITALVTGAAFSAPYWWQWPRDEDIVRPIIPIVGHSLVSLLWRGMFLGLGLIIFDGLAGRWQRPARWAAAGLLVSGVLERVLPWPTDWAALPGMIRAGRWMGLLPADTWSGWLLLVANCVCSAAWGWWVGRAVPHSGRPHGRLIMAGLEAGVVLWFASALCHVPLALRHLGEHPRPWDQLWGEYALSLTASILAGSLDGVAIAVALWATRPQAASEAATPQ